MPIEVKREGIYGRVIKFGDGKEITFVKHKQIELGHQFDRLISVNELYADEAFVELVLYIDDEVLMRGELMMKDSKTDRLNFLTCPIEVNDLNKVVKDKEDTKVNVFGNSNLEGNFDEAAPKSKVLLQPKKIRENSTHEMGDADMNLLTEPIVYDIGGPIVVVPETLQIANPFGLLTVDQSDAASSYFVSKGQQYVNAGPGNAVPSTYTAGDLSNIQNLYFDTPAEVSLRAENIHIKAEGPNVIRVLIRLQVAVITYDNENKDNIADKRYITIKEVNSKEAVINETISFSVPRFTRLIYETRVYVLNERAQTSKDRITLYAGGRIVADTIDIYPASFAGMTRLIQAGKKILSNITNGKALVIAPRFESEFWWYFITSGYYIRGFEDESFDLSFKDWKEFIQKAFNCDVQIGGDNVFIGKHEDFYVDQEIARIEFRPDLDNYEITINEDLVFNKVNLKYKNFESDKKDTLDAFHTESEWFIPKRNRASYDKDLGFTADGYSIEYARREGINAEPTTSKQKDNDVYIVDCFMNRIHLPPIAGGGYVDILQNRQSQGFEVTPGTVFDPHSLYNIRLSLKRLILDHYAIRFAEIGQKLNNGFPAPSTEFLINTFFKANGDLKTRAIDSNLQTFPDWVVENGNVEQSQLKPPIISPEIYNFTLAKRYKYSELIRLYKNIVSKKGYVTLFAPDGTEKKVYIFDASYDWAKEILTFKAEKKT